MTKDWLELAIDERNRRYYREQSVMRADAIDATRTAICAEGVVILFILAAAAVLL